MPIYFQISTFLIICIDKYFEHCILHIGNFLMTVKQKIASISKSPYQYHELFYPEYDNVTSNYLNYPESS